MDEGDRKLSGPKAMPGVHPSFASCSLQEFPEEPALLNEKVLEHSPLPAAWWATSPQREGRRRQGALDAF